MVLEILYYIGIVLIALPFIVLAVVGMMSGGKKGTRPTQPASKYPPRGKISPPTSAINKENN